MKKNIYKLFIIICSLHFTSCGSDFLDIETIDNLTGNNFWKTKDDVESFNISMYSRLRNATMINTPFFLATGDFRCAPIKVNNEHSWEQFLGYLRNNDLGSLLSNSRYAEPNGEYGLWQITEWTSFYEVIQLANILYEKIDDVPPGELTEEDIKSYRAQAIFMRNLSYFFLVRTYGDVPYYTNAFNNEPLPRTDMIEILNKGMVELNSIKEDLPWTYEDGSQVGVRAMRGSVIALLMHMNMWAAGFDNDNKMNYYQNVADLGMEIMDENQGAYGLIPLDNTSEIFSGGSKEGLFEIVQNVNAGEQFPNSSVYSNYVVKIPYMPYETPKIYYDLDFMRKIYPPTEVDRRRELWYDADIYSTDGSQQLLKFVNPYQSPNGGRTSNVGNQIVFRYTDVVLLRAEALAELDRDTEALEMINLIRDRAGADRFEFFGQTLKDNIYWERVRELMGEGQYYYDLVRTRKVVDGSFSFAPISISAFNNGAWTWPINRSALDNNPYIILNQYWN